MSLKSALSGREFQLRYTLLRTILIARGIDPLPAAYVRVEWNVHGYLADIVFEDARGNVIEVVEVKEHDGYLQAKSIHEFGDIVERLRGLLPGTRFRFVTNARFLPDGTDLLKNTARRNELAGAAAPHIVFDLDVEKKDALLAIALMQLEPARDAHGLYGRLHTRLAGDMAERLPEERGELERLTRNLHQFLILPWNDAKGLPGGLRSSRLAIDEVRRVLDLRSRQPIAAPKVERAVLPDGEVVLEDIFVDPAAVVRFENITGGTGRTSSSALSLLFEWVASVRRGDPRLAGLSVIREPLFVLGGFGTGKSSLLKVFEERLSTLGIDVTPIFIEMRSLIGAGTSLPLRDVLQSAIHTRYGIDIFGGSVGDIVLLCDGFDELDVFFMHADQRQWVEQAYREIVWLAQQANLTIVVSSRPVLLMGVRRAHPGAASIEIQPFDTNRIAEWCGRYTSAAGVSSDFSLQFLEARNLVDVSRMPLVLYMIARIYATLKEMLEAKRYTPGAVYNLFVTWTEKGGYAEDHPDKHLVPKNYRHILQDIAWRFFLSGETMIPEDDLLAELRETYGEKIDRIPVDRNLFVAHMFLPAGGGEHSRMLEFAHQSFREYLVAERVWRLLESARERQDLSPEAWNALGEAPFSAAEVGFLLDMADELKPRQRESLYYALRDAADIRSYAGNSSPARVATRAALALILRICLGGDAYELQPLLSFMDAFAATNSTIAQARTLLLRHLRGIRIEGPASLSRMGLGGAVLDQCVMHSVNLDQAFLRGVSIAHSSFIACSFRQVNLETEISYHATFKQCDFREARIEITNDLALGTTWGMTFDGCTFDGVYFDRLELAQCTLVLNSWDRAVVYDGILAGCIVDDEAEEFFRRNGVHLKGCHVVSAEKLRRLRYERNAAR